MNNNLTCSMIRDPESFRKIKKEWEDLIENSESKNIFLTWEWMHTWWTVYGKKCDLALFAARDMDGRLIGLAPFKTVKSGPLTGYGRLEFIGDGGDVKTEYLDIIARRGYESSVGTGLVKILHENRGIDVVDLKGYFPANGGSKRMDFGWPLQWTRQHSKCPVFELPVSWPQYLSAKSRNFRKKAKEYQRICLRDLRLEIVRVNSSNELPFWMKELGRLHHLRWRGKSGSFNSESYLLFHREIAKLFLEKDWLRLFFLLDGDKPIAGLYCFSYQGVYYYYQSGRDPAYSKYHLGYVLMNLAIQEAIKEGARYFDMLTGEEAYKYHWATKENITLALSAYRKKSVYLLHSAEMLLKRTRFF